MLEVFKTNVEQSDDARRVLDEIKNKFDSYSANFDLQDCDHILRVECRNGSVDVRALTNLMAHLGFAAEVLSDDTYVE